MSILKSIMNRQYRRTTAQFLRFLNRNYNAYAAMCINNGASNRSDINQTIATACRDWLPGLSDPAHRRVCEAISQVHEASAKRTAALDVLMTTLDDLRKQSSAIESSCTEVSDNKHDRSNITSTERPTSSNQCCYCGAPNATPAYFLSGEPSFVCDSSKCISEHDRMLRAEHEDFVRSGPLADPQYH